jgi:hypothetical protein
MADINSEVSYLWKIDLLNDLEKNPSARQPLLVLFADQIMTLRAYLTE